MAFSQLSQLTLTDASLTTVFRASALLALGAAFLFYAALTHSSSAGAKERTVKQKAWIVTLLSSTLTTAGSVPFLLSFLTNACILTPAPSLSNPGENLSYELGLLVLAHAMCGAFQGFLIADLLIGVHAYPSEVSLLTGWVHHIVYALLLPYVASHRWAHVFALCLSMEAPTAHLAAARLFPSYFRADKDMALRNDVAHAAVFFVFRIALHVRVIALAASGEVRECVFAGSWAPAGLLCAAFALHAWWFSCAVSGIRKRAFASASAKSTATTDGTTQPQSTAKVTAVPLVPVRPSLMRRRSSVTEYIIVKSRSARAHARKRAPWILAVPAVYTLMKVRVSTCLRKL